MAELITSKTLFPGSDHIDQLTRIMKVTGTPNDELLAKLASEEARNYIRSLPTMKKKNFKAMFHGANLYAIDLLEKMLELDADKRITAEEALAHDYLCKYSDPTDEPVSEPYDQSFEAMEMAVPEWKRLVYEEIKNFVPKPLQQQAF